MPTSSQHDGPVNNADRTLRALEALEARQLDPEHVLAPGRADAAVLLAVVCLRRTFLPILVGGVAVAAFENALDAERVEDLNTPAQILGALLSPLAGIVLALGIRFVAGGLSLVLAFPLSRWVTQDPRRSRLRQRPGAWMDRVFVTRAYQSLRWAGWTRQAALDRAGPLAGRIVWWFDLVVNVAWVVIVAALVVLTASHS